MKNRQDRKEIRRKEAEDRNAKWKLLTPQEQLAELDKRGVVAKKQREKIERILSSTVQ